MIKKVICQFFFTGKNKIIRKNKSFTPISTPHGKFYKSKLWYSLVNLRENVPYQDTVLYNDLASKAKNIFYISTPLAVWWQDRIGNSTTQEWNEERAKIWLETCLTIANLKGCHNEVNSWILMYLWELNRNFKLKTPFKINIDTKKAKFKWLPFGTRHIAKFYFLIKTKKFRSK